MTIKEWAGFGLMATIFCIILYFEIRDKLRK